ncbi:MAG: hypothetical protein SPJ65_01215 [Roseburia sp.]|nr:hypothetical protein [Roseburia sp.]
MGKLKIKQKKKAFIPYTNQQAHMFAQSIQNCQKELKEMEKKAYEDGFEDGKNWSDAVNLITLFFAMNKLHKWGWKRYMEAIKEANKYIDQINSGETSMAKLAEEMEKKHKMRIDDDYKELIERYGA